MSRIDLTGIRARAAAAFTARRSAISLCFLVALTAGVSLYLLAVDFLFDYLVYSLFGAVLAVAAYLAPLVILASRMERALTTDLLETAGLMDAALVDHSPEALVREEQIRQILLRSGRLDLAWWHWLHPLGVLGPPSPGGAPVPMVDPEHAMGGYSGEAQILLRDVRLQSDRLSSGNSLGRGDYETAPGAPVRRDRLRISASLRRLGARRTIEYALRCSTSLLLDLARL